MKWYCLKELRWKPEYCSECKYVTGTNQEGCESLKWAEVRFLFYDHNPEMEEIAEEGWKRLNKHRLEMQKIRKKKLERILK